MTMQFTRLFGNARLETCSGWADSSGKTYGALTIAKGLGGRIAVIDTERGSASLYSHLTEFDTLSLDPPYAPERFIEAVQAAEAAGYDVIVIDSITHEWNGSGGVLEIVDNIAKASRSGSSYNAWNEGTRRHRAFIDAMLQSFGAHHRDDANEYRVWREERKERPHRDQRSAWLPEQRDGMEILNSRSCWTS
ncbi:MAG: AAA family ATPase [Xanthomonadales bacterium]|nr:AAA family ATPase [Xanthomonadales bacterium]